MRLELERGPELFFQKFQTNYQLSVILFLCFVCCSFTSDSHRTFVALQFALRRTQQSLNLIKK